MPEPVWTTLSVAAASEAETARFAQALAPVLGVGDVLLLDGTLGAGKTTFVRSLAEGLGHDARLVSSPTFVLVNRYATPGQITLLHADAYRLTDGDELDTLGLSGALAGHDDVVLAVEWPERLGDGLALIPPAHLAQLRLEHTGVESRQLTLVVPSAWGRRPGFGAIAMLAGNAQRPATRCPVTGDAVAPDNPWWPFASERARLVDLGKWLSGSYVISRELTQDDMDEGPG